MLELPDLPNLINVKNQEFAQSFPILPRPVDMMSVCGRLRNLNRDTALFRLCAWKYL
jgi:hypothetical protein